MPRGAPLLLLCVACALVGALAALLVQRADTPPRIEPAHESLTHAVDRLAREVAALERRGSVAGETPRPVLAPAPPPARTEAGAEPGERRVATPHATAAAAQPDAHVRRTTADEVLPATNRARVAEVVPWEQHEESDAQRARWLFASEQAVLDWFGTPDAVHPYEHGERWDYKRTDAHGGHRDLHIILLRGRVTRMLP